MTMRLAAAAIAAATALPLAQAAAQSGGLPNLGTVVTSPAQTAYRTANEWYTDRYRPAGFQSVAGGFQGRNSVVQITVSDADNRAGRIAQNGGNPAFGGGFYGTQGRKVDLAPNATELFVDLWVPQSWSNAANGYRETGLWAAGTSVPNVNTNTTPGNITAYPAVYFTNVGFNTRFTGWQYWDTGVNDVIDLPTVAVNYGAWNTIGFRLDTGANTFTYFINGQNVATVTAVGSLALDAGFLNTFNFADDYNGPNLLFPNMPDNPAGGAVYYYANVVPEPSTYALMGTGLVALALAARRKRAA